MIYAFLDLRRRLALFFGPTPVTPPPPRVISVWVGGSFWIRPPISHQHSSEPTRVLPARPVTPDPDAPETPTTVN